MKKNLPITNKEVTLKPGGSIISTTDTKGIITYVNREFIDISGFSEQELVGSSHNVVRHPDMPAAAFEDLWNTVQAGRPWHGMVKNRCKNGDHFWVDAFVSPIRENGQLVGYQSVRTAPSKGQVRRAEAQYAKLSQHAGAKLKKPFKLGDIGIMKRIGFALLLVGLLPLGADLLWKAGVFSSGSTLAAALLSPLLLAGMGLYVYQSMFKPMRTLGEELDAIASGRLDRPIDPPSGDELGALFASVKMLQARFRTLVGQMSEVSVDLAGGAQMVSDTSAQTFQMMLSQQQSTANANSSMQHMRDAVHEVAGHTRDAVDVASEANDAAIRGKGTISGLRGTIESLVGEVESSAEVILDLNAKSQDIRSILEVIRSIAEQTNLLALNAAIEAARAGEQGRGFAVVADEVRTLASRTAEATEETNAVIEQLQQGIDSAVQVMKHGQQTAGEAAEKSSNALNSIDELSMAVVRMTAMNAQIAESANNQLFDADAITQDMATITTMAGQTLAVTQTNSEAGNRLSAVSSQLVEQFRQFGVVNDLQRQIEASRNRQQQEIGGSSTQDDDSILF